MKPNERFKAHQVIYTDMDYYVSQKGQQIFDAKVLDWIHTILPESPTKKDLLYIHATTGKNIGLYVKNVDADDILLCIYGSAIIRNGKCIHGSPGDALKCQSVIAEIKIQSLDFRRAVGQIMLSEKGLIMLFIKNLMKTEVQIFLI